MRPAALLALIAAPLAGCGVDCGSPTQVNGVYAVFANVVEFEGTNLEAFPSYQSPANGMREWQISWDRVTNEIAVAIEGQEYQATGVWNDIECGNFTLEFGGPYASLEGTQHDFFATGEMVVFASQLEGSWQYQEDWTGKDGETGSFSADGNLSGEKVGLPE